jgi:lipocalin
MHHLTLLGALLPGIFWIPLALALTPVTGFDLNRYLGTWYEIAAIPGYLQSGCARDTMTEYTPAENGAIAAASRCLRADGTPQLNEGRTRPLEPTLPSVLKVTSVRFLGIWWYPLGRDRSSSPLIPAAGWWQRIRRCVMDASWHASLPVGQC